MAILKVANVFHDSSGYTRTQISTANTITWVTSNEVKATLNVTGVLHVHQGINTSNLLVNGVPAIDVANSYAYSTGLAAGAGANTVGSAAFAKANAALANGDVTLQGTLTVTGGFQVNSLPAYALANIRYFTGTTANTVYTPPANCRAILVEIVGGGGGGGSANGIGGTSGAGARGGGGGGYTALLIANTNQIFKYTVGLGGPGAVAGASGEVQGSGGAPTYFYGGSLGTTVLLAIGGGAGGNFMKATTTGDLISDDGGSGGVSWGADGSIVVPGAPGGGGMRGTLFSMMLGGRGGHSFLSLPTAGAQQSGTGQTTGTAGVGFGSGGGGGAVVDSSGNPSGGDGQSGVVKITEFL